MQELGKLLIKLLKGQSRLTTFRLALALSLTRVHRYQVPFARRGDFCGVIYRALLLVPPQDTVLDALKSRTHALFKTQSMLSMSPLLMDMFSSHLVPIDRMLLEVVEHSKAGWDHVIHGLVQMGLTLIDNYAYDQTPLVTPTPAHACCQLGNDMLVATFRAHELVRSDILDQLLARIIAKRGEAISHYLRTLTM